MEDVFFSEDFIKLYISKYFTEEKTRLSPEALKLTLKLIELFVKEAIGRSAKQCQIESVDTMDADQLEKILPQLLLDF